MTYTAQMLKVEDILKKSGLTENTAVQYVKRLVRLNKRKPFKSLAFVKKTEKIMEYMKNEVFSPSSTESYVAMIISVLKKMPTKSNDKAREQYEKILENPSGYYEKKDKSVKTEKQKNNWIEKEYIDTKINQLKSKTVSLNRKKNITQIEWNYLLDYFVVSLYTLLQPRRNIDYIDMIINEDNEKSNIIDTTKREMTFRNYKTVKTYGEQTISYADNKEFIKVLNLYLKHRPKNNNNLLVKYDGVPLYTSNQITRILNRIFERNVSSSMLRHIYLTDKYKDVSDEMVDDANKMGHSISTQQTMYVKND
jgi:hypothetical protein